jgi:hypothetical protein
MCSSGFGGFLFGLVDHLRSETVRITYNRLMGTCARACLAAGAAFWIAGCSPEGTGSIDIEKPAEVRAKALGEVDKAPTQAPTQKQAKVKELIDEAAKKRPKLQ